MAEPRQSPDLRSSARAAPCARDVIAVRGAEALAYLQGQLSQDVEALVVGESAPSLLLQPTGKVDAWLRVTRIAEEEVLLDVDAGWGDAVHARLRRFLLRTRATLEPATWTGLAVRGAGAAAVTGDAVGEPVLRLPVTWPGVEGVDLLGPDGAVTDVPRAPEADLEVLRVEAGVPRMGAEISEATIPAELGQWLIDASVSFTKGCYTGQELVARIDSRGGNVPRPIRGLRVDGPAPAPGAAVTAGGAAVGSVTSAAVSGALGAIALAPVARSVDIGASVEVEGPDGPTPGTVVELPFR